MALHFEHARRISSILLALLILVAIASAIDFVGGGFERLPSLVPPF